MSSSSPLLELNAIVAGLVVLCGGTVALIGATGLGAWILGL